MFDTFVLQLIVESYYFKKETALGSGLPEPVNTITEFEGGNMSGVFRDSIENRIRCGESMNNYLHTRVKKDR